MAKYDNRFLVQYFKDIYALYIIRGKVEERLEHVKSEISALNRGEYYNPYPEQPEVEHPQNAGCLFGTAGLMGIVLVAVILINLFHDYGGFGTIMLVICGILFFLCIVLAFSDKEETQSRNEAAQKAYQEALIKYRKLETKNDLHREKVPALQEAAVRYENELRKIESLMKKAYSINIIPNQYRDFYTIVYLYDYFEGSRETDLAMALNTYVLEQIKDRLDRIISQLSEMILNQYTMIQNQHMAAEEASRYHIDMKNRLNRIEATNEERNVYLDMIESNTATMRYFATVDYLTK